MYQPYWDSLRNYTVPDWFKDAKLGVFIHWGAYAVPADESEWYPRFMYQREHPVFQRHRERWGDTFGYKDFIPMFRGENFDPQAWVDLIVEAGAKYVVPVAEHHDGFAMYDTPYTRWNAAKMGPRRDVICDLKQAARAAGLYFGLSSHRAYNWRYFTYEDEFDTADPAYADIYSPVHAADQPATLAWLSDWHSRTRELIDRFEPDLLWFDFGWHEAEFTPYRPEIAAYYYNRALEQERGVVLTYKDMFPDGTAVYDVERGKLSGIREDCWQTDTSVSYKSWCYIEDDELKSVTTLVHDLVDIVSKNGNLLLNIGPRADGTIPDEQADVLRGIGRWLVVNGEAIHGSRPWETFGTGEARIADGWHTERENDPLGEGDLRFTSKGDDIFVIMPVWPGHMVKIAPMGTDSSVTGETIKKISLLGGPVDLSWTQTSSGLTVLLPDEAPNEHASVLKITRS